MYSILCDSLPEIIIKNTWIICEWLHKLHKSLTNVVFAAFSKFNVLCILLNTSVTYVVSTGIKSHLWKIGDLCRSRNDRFVYNHKIYEFPIISPLNILYMFRALLTLGQCRHFIYGWCVIFRFINTKRKHCLKK